jgi:hypothetical protein
MGSTDAARQPFGRYPARAIVHGGGLPGSEVSLDQLLHGVLLQLGLGQQPLEAVSAASLFRRLVASACPTGARRRVL